MQQEWADSLPHEFGVNLKSVKNNHSPVYRFLANINDERVSCTFIGLRGENSALATADFATIFIRERHALDTKIRYDTICRTSSPC